MYWKKNNEFRTAESIYELIEENYKRPSHKIFKKYKPPTIAAKDYNNLIRNIKRQTFESRENIKKKVQYENPAASKEKIDAIVYKRMYSSIRDELHIATGKKKSPQKLLATVEDTKHHLTESEMIKKIETMLEEERKKLQMHKLLMKEERKKKRRQELEAKNYKDSMMNTNMSNKGKSSPLGSKIQTQISKDLSAMSKYPIEGEEYRKILREKEEEDQDETNRSKEYSGENDVDGNIFTRVINTFKQNENMKNYKRNLSKNNPWYKYEYYHTGTFVIYIKLFRLNLYLLKSKMEQIQLVKIYGKINI
jgi:hypothetical protein